MDDEVLEKKEIKYQINIDTFSSSNPNDMKAVEFIVPFYNNYSDVVRLLESLFSTIATNRYQITLVDDGSDNKNFIKELNNKKIVGLNCLRVEENKGFGAAINYALKNPKNNWIPFICILHTDVLPNDMLWLSKIGSCYQKLKLQNVKMISPRSNFFGDDLKHLETTRDQKVDDYILKENEYLSLFCSLCHRDLFKKIGYFEEYPYAGCEVEEFALRMQRNGYKQGICGKSWIHHQGEGTLGKIDKKKREILRKTVENFRIEKNKYLESLNNIV